MHSSPWDTRIFGDPVVIHGGPVVNARFVRFGAAYTREVKIGQPALVAVLAAAGLPSVLMALIRRGSRRRRFRDLKKGPEFLVTPVRLRDDVGVAYEVELHGHLAQSALHPGDLVQVFTRTQKDPDLPDRIDHVVNLTTYQVLTPHVPTLWSHLGPALLLQACVGLLVVAVIAAVSL
jgi:hypothetical protein